LATYFYIVFDDNIAHLLRFFEIHRRSWGHNPKPSPPITAAGLEKMQLLPITVSSRIFTLGGTGSLTDAYVVIQFRLVDKSAHRLRMTVLTPI
jgi:hypothetical protein